MAFCMSIHICTVKMWVVMMMVVSMFHDAHDGDFAVFDM